MASKLPPLNFKDEVNKYEAFQETKEVEFVACPHKETKIVNGTLKCKCGAGWSSSIDNLLHLQKLLQE